jgi:hypothetical protein
MTLAGVSAGFACGFVAGAISGSVASTGPLSGAASATTVCNGSIVAVSGVTFAGATTASGAPVSNGVGNTIALTGSAVSADAAFSWGAGA